MIKNLIKLLKFESDKLITYIHTHLKFKYFINNDLIFHIILRLYLQKWLNFVKSNYIMANNNNFILMKDTMMSNSCSKCITFDGNNKCTE